MPMTSETAALSSFENAVTHICAYCDIESDYGYHVSEFTFTVGHYLERIQSDKHYKVKHLTSSAEFDIETFQKILKKVKISNDRLNHILYTRCFTIIDLEAEINALLNNTDPEKQVDMLVIEDLCDLFNFEFFRDDTKASAHIVILFRKLRKLAQIKGISVILYERNTARTYNSRHIDGYIQTLYDNEVTLEQTKTGDLSVKFSSTLPGKRDQITAISYS